MTELSNIPMKELQKNDILKDNSISWIIKYDILKADNIYEVTLLNENTNYDRYSEEIKFMRKYNRDNEPYKKFNFNLHTNKVYYTIKEIKLSSTEEDLLEFAYNNEYRREYNEEING